MKQFNIEKMRKACLEARLALEYVSTLIKPGISTDDINRYVHNFTVKRGGYPAPLNYRGFPKSCCTSVNDVVCHGIPSNNVILKSGDIVNVDVTTIFDDHFGDTNATFAVGDCTSEALELISHTKQCRDSAIQLIRPGVTLGDLGKYIQRLAEGYGHSVVKEFGGHGIGTFFHLQPHIAHYDSGDNTVLKPGMVFTIEPMINAGSSEIYICDDNWTVRTRDGSLSAQFEHTVLVTDDGVEVLT